MEHVLPSNNEAVDVQVTDSILAKSLYKYIDKLPQQHKDILNFTLINNGSLKEYSKNNNINYIHRKAPSLNYVLSNREVTQDYHFKFPKKKKEQNKNDDNHFYEIKGPKKFLENLEDNIIKKNIS